MKRKTHYPLSKASYWQDVHRLKISIVFSLAAMILIMAIATELMAAEFRAIRPISAPAALPPGAVAVAPNQVEPVSRSDVRRAIELFTASFTDTQFADFLSDSFFDKQGLLDNIAAFVPRDTKVRVLSVQGIQTVGQRIFPERGIRQSDVTASVRLQIEFDDPNAGVQRIEDVGDIFFRFSEKI